MPDHVSDDEVIAEIYCHIIFWTRKLQPVLSSEMLAGACEAMDQAMFAVQGEALAAGGTENHLHILARLSPDHTVAEALAVLRQRSEACASACGKEDFVLSENEVAVTISPNCLDKAKEFIENQASYHEHVTFESELKAIFDEHGFEFNERELWE
jgi:REP element-mobilizing transposase RayT